jgi:fimbrial isopeptide formation D2 family protein/LPXTG-motif cell wall-anchored protein
MKRKITRVLAALFAMVMLVSCMSFSAFADDPVEYVEAQGTASNGHVYELYQIFAGTIGEKGEISNATWGANSNPTSESNPIKNQNIGDPVDNTVLNEIKDLTSKTDSEKLATILKYADLNSTPFNTSTTKRIGDSTSSTDFLDQPVDTVGNGDGDTGYRTFTVASGYYLIKDKTGSLDGTESKSYTLYVVKTSNGTINFKTKDSSPTVTKVIDDGSAKGTDKNLVAIGDKISYKIAGTVSSQIGSFKTYYYKFTDTLSAGLTYNKDAKITMTATKADGTGTITQDVTKFFGFSNSNADAANKETKLVWAAADLLKFNNLTAEDKTVDSNGDEVAWTPIVIDTSTTLNITYSATLNQYAQPAVGITDTNKDGNPDYWNSNKIDLTYYNDPNNSGESTSKDKPGDDPTKDPPEPDPKYPKEDTEDVTVHSFTGSLTIEKQNGSNEPLNGAQFTLTLKSKDGVTDLSTVSEKMVVSKTDSTFTKYTGDGSTQVKDKAGNKYYLSDVGVKNEGVAATVSAIQLYTLDGQLLYWKLNKGYGTDGDTSTSSITYTTRNPYNGGTAAGDIGLYDNPKEVYVRTAGTTTTSDVNTAGSYTVTGTVDDSGMLTFTGMCEGVYTLTETQAPSGYQKISPMDITVSFENGSFVVTNNAGATISYVEGDGSYHVVIEDKTAQQLPDTGGIGTTIFYVAGSALALGAIVLLITKKRMSNEVG